MSPVWNVKRTRCYKNSFFLTIIVVVALLFCFVLHFFFGINRDFGGERSKKTIRKQSTHWRNCREFLGAFVLAFASKLLILNRLFFWVVRIYWNPVFSLLRVRKKRRRKNSKFRILISCLVLCRSELWWWTGRQTHNNILFNNRLNRRSANCHVLRPINPFVWGFFQWISMRNANSDERTQHLNDSNALAFNLKDIWMAIAVIKSY